MSEMGACKWTDGRTIDRPYMQRLHSLRLFCYSNLWLVFIYIGMTFLLLLYSYILIGCHYLLLMYKINRNILVHLKWCMNVDGLYSFISSEYCVMQIHWCPNQIFSGSHDFDENVRKKRLFRPIVPIKLNKLLNKLAS